MLINNNHFHSSKPNSLTYIKGLIGESNTFSLWVSKQGNLCLFFIHIVKIFRIWLKMLSQSKSPIIRVARQYLATILAFHFLNFLGHQINDVNKMIPINWFSLTTRVYLLHASFGIASWNKTSITPPFQINMIFHANNLQNKRTKSKYLQFLTCNE